MRDEQAFIDRVSQHTPALLRFVRRLTGNQADAEDVIQDTLVRALAKREELRNPLQLKPWLLAIARTSWLNSRRGLRHKLEVLEDACRCLEPDGAAGNLEVEVLDRSLSDELLAALDALPQEWREALWLREVEDLSYAEIAAVAGCPVGTVRSRLARARVAVAAHLRRERNDGL